MFDKVRKCQIAYCYTKCNQKLCISLVEEGSFLALSLIWVYILYTLIRYSRLILMLFVCVYDSGLRDTRKTNRGKQLGDIVNFRTIGPEKSKLTIFTWNAIIKCVVVQLDKDVMQLSLKYASIFCIYESTRKGVILV